MPIGIVNQTGNPNPIGIVPATMEMTATVIARNAADAAIQLTSNKDDRLDSPAVSGKEH